MYDDGEFERFRGLRLLAIDGSTLRLPDTPATREEFGYVTHVNGTGSCHQGQVEAKMAVLYDVLNEIPVTGTLERGRTCELVVSTPLLKKIGKGDLLLADRFYGCYSFFSAVRERGADYCIRCKETSYRQYHKISKDAQRGDVTVVIARSTNHAETLPESQTVRFLQLWLPSGEREILATSLLDRKKYPYRLFQKLYYRRWRIETYFQVLKSRLSLDNFSGKSVEALYQDFFSTLFVSGLETIVTEDAQAELAKRRGKNKLKVNKALSFHTIKTRVIHLLDDPPDNLIEEITTLFQANPTAVRPEREKPPRRSAKTWANRRSLYFQRYRRKHAF
jgi:hypothetical protein